jgi:hypothetical protein
MIPFLMIASFISTIVIAVDFARYSPRSWLDMRVD